MRTTSGIFSDVAFFAFSQARQSEAASTILTEDSNYLLNVNETEYLQHLESRFRLDPITFDFDHITMAAEERMVPASRFPPMSIVTPGRSYPKQAFIFHVPFSGTLALLKCVPSQHYAGTVLQCEISSNEISFEIIDMYGDGNRVRQEQERMRSHLEMTAQWLLQDVGKYNQNLGLFLQQQFQNRKNEILKQRQIAASVGVPFRQKDKVLC
jgi:hypothetical protein